MEKKRKGYKSSKQQAEANKRYRATEAGKQAQKKAVAKSQAKKFVKEFATKEELRELKKIIKEELKMTRIEEIKKEIERISTTLEEFENEVIVAFGDYEYNGETEVIVSKQSKDRYLAYIASENSPQFTIDVDVDKEEETIEVVAVYIKGDTTDYEDLVGKAWKEAKDVLEEQIFVDEENVDKETGDCIVDFRNCAFLSVKGSYKVVNDEVVIEVNDEEKIYNNRG